MNIFWKDSFDRLILFSLDNAARVLVGSVFYDQKKIAVSRCTHSELNIVYLFNILRIRPFLSM